MKPKPAAVSKLRVVVVDDVALTRSLISETLLKLQRFDVVGEAQRWHRGSNAIERLKPDLVTLDLAMPKMGGIEVLEQLNPHKIGAKVIVLSALHGETAREKCLQLGAAAIFDKTLQFEDFQSALAEL